MPEIVISYVRRLRLAFLLASTWAYTWSPLSLDCRIKPHRARRKYWRSILTCAGITGNYSSHSFRIGAATAAAAAGIPDHLIKVMECWASTAYQRYIRTSLATLADIAQHLAQWVGAVGWEEGYLSVILSPTHFAGTVTYMRYRNFIIIIITPWENGYCKVRTWHEDKPWQPLCHSQG